MPNVPAPRLLLGLSCLAALTLACALGGAGPTPAQDPAAPGSSEETPHEQGPLEFTIQPRPLLPSDPAAAFLEGVQGGRWTYEEGLLRGLSALAGQGAGEAASPAGAAVVRGSISGMLRLARAYLREGEDPAVQQELRRLLSALAPRRESLDSYAAPEEDASLRGAGLAAPVRQTDCVDLAGRGFPEGEGLLCLRYRALTLAGDEYRVYYPASWGAGHPARAMLEPALAALRDSVGAYSRLGDMGPADLVFSLLSAGDPGMITGADAELDEDGARCSIVVYPEGAESVRATDFQQLLAHELFHCFQAWNLADQYDRPAEVANEWWVEGSAEYFSNWVYPANDLEHTQWLTDFNRRSESLSLLDMDYASYLFFQYLENRLGVEGVLDLLRAMPISGGRAEQQAALAGYPGMQDLLQDFARAYLDNGVRDSSGRAITILHGAQLGRVVPIDGPLAEPFSATPFVLQRARLAFVPGNVYSVRAAASGAEGSEAARPPDEPGAWSAFPESLEAGCPPTVLVLSLTTASGGEAVRSLALDVSVVEEVGADLSGCEDPCLVGTWELDNSTYQRYFEATVGEIPDLSYQGVEGRAWARFDEEHRLTGAFEGFTLRYQHAMTSLLGDPRPIDIRLRFEGESASDFYADGSLILTSNADFTFQVNGELDMGGMLVPLDLSLVPDDLPGGELFGVATYVCTADRLFYTPPVPGLPLGILEMIRLEP